MKAGNHIKLEGSLGSEAAASEILIDAVAPMHDSD